MEQKRGCHEAASSYILISVYISENPKLLTRASTFLPALQ